MSAHLSFDYATAAAAGVVITWAESLEDSVLALSHSVSFQIQFSISFRNGNAAAAATNLSEVVMR